MNPPDGTTRYIDQVVAFADDDVAFSYISVGNLLARDYDVVHFHWPEMIVRHRWPLIESVKCFAFDVWVRTLARRRTAIVRTLHNPRPHEAPRRAVARSLRRLDAATDLFVVINSTDEAPEGSLYIPHGHYRDRFASHQKQPLTPGRLLYAGLIRPYKGVEQLIAAFESAADTECTLRIVGKPTPELRESITVAADADPRISSRLDFVPDDEFVREITQAELVCLPYRDLHNSGILLVALSLDRPVLVPDTPSTRMLAEEVGPGWVITFTGVIDADDISAALAIVRGGGRAARPALTDRDWERVGKLYSAAFRQARARTTG